MIQKQPHSDCNTAQTQTSYSFQIQRLDECETAARKIQNLFKKDTDKDIMTGCHELLVNAIEHGNLEITSQQKMSFIQGGTLLTFLESRLKEEPYKQRHVYINCERSIYNNKQAIAITIKDDGNGFDWKHQIKSNVASDQIHGRGILIAKEFSFDELTYNPCGNQVTGIIYI